MRLFTDTDRRVPVVSQTDTISTRWADPCCSANIKVGFSPMFSDTDSLIVPLDSDHEDCSAFRKLQRLDRNNY